MRNATLVALLLLILGGFLAAPTISAQEKPAAVIPKLTHVRFNITFGGQANFTTEDRWTKFMQFRDIPKNATLSEMGFVIEKEGSLWHLSGHARDATQLDQRYRLVLEKEGKTRTEFRYDGFPNFISRLVQSPAAKTAPGFFSFNDMIRGSLQAAASADVPGLVNNFIRATPFSDLRVRRQRFLVRQEFHLTNNWTTFFEVMRERRRGSKPIGFGSYERSQTATGGFFNVLGQELPEPIDYRTTQLRAGIGFQNRRGMVRFEYRGSWFENRITALTWQNPFSLTDQQGSQPAGAGNRWRFATGQLDLYPDNRAHNITIAARVNLPAASFLSGLLSWSFWRQDDRLLPWTLNTAIVTAVQPGIRPTDSATLPRPSLDGAVNVFNSDVVLGTRKWAKLLLTARYRSYRYHNETEELRLPGYAAFGEAFWRTNINNVPFTELHEPNSFFRQQTSLEGVWKPTEGFHLKVEPYWEGWNRIHRQVGRSNEWGVKNQVIYQPVKWFNARANYRHGSRAPRSYDVGPLEFSGFTSGLAPGGFLSGLRRFDQAHRVHNDTGLLVNFLGNKSLNVSATYNYLSDRYDRSYFGLGSFLNGTAGIEVNYAADDRYGLVAFYNHDRTRYNYRSIAKGAGNFTWVPDNEWDRNTRDKVDSFGIGFNALWYGQKALFSASWDFSLAEQRITTANPGTFMADAANDARAFPWPDVKSRFHEVRVETSYRFRPNMQFGVRYLFEPYRLSDFAWDIMRPYMFGFEAPENDVRRYLYLNSRYGDTNAHLVGLYLRYTF